MIQRRVLAGPVGPTLVHEAGRWAQDLGASFQLGDADRYRLEVCVEELTTNLVKYGHAPAGGAPMAVTADVGEQLLCLEIVDGCAPFDPLNYDPAPIPDTLDELQVGGRGVQLIRALSDDIAYEHRDGHNRLTLTFALKEPAQSPPRPDSLGGVAMFRDVPETMLDHGLGALTIRETADDELLLERGQANDSVLVVLEGTLRVYLDRPEGDDFIEVGTGQCVGEMSVIDDKPVSAFVVAPKGSRLLVIDADTFLHRVLAIPRVARNLLTAQDERMRSSNNQAIERMRQLMAVEQARREMDLARDIQASMLPKEPLFTDEPRVNGDGRMLPAREVGGDFYDVFFLDSRHLLFVVADVCGKGLPAALFMVRAISALRAQPRQQTPPEGYLQDLVASLNDQLCDHNDAGQYFTAFFGVLDVETYHLRYLIAGHNPPLVALGHAPFEYLRDPINPPVGMISGLRYKAAELQLEPGSRLVVYTDGVTEAEAVDGDMLGEDRLLARCLALPDAGSAKLVDAVFTQVQSFATGAKQSDDITVLAIGCVSGGDSLSHD
jgi:serine phosphatase RsbU (regulator of sigma subunit)/anti-sigma regulatory factor (Ser/Thr protein kinase)